MSNPAEGSIVGMLDYGLGGEPRANPVGPDEVDPLGNDQLAFNAMVDLLSATGRWTTVKHATADEVLFPSEGDYPFAAIVPKGGNEVDTFDHGVFLRTVNYTLVLALADQEPLARKALLGSLEAVARNTLAGVSYGGFCLPVWSKLGQASHPKPAHPMQRVEIPGSFAYLVNGFPNRDTNTYYYPN